MQSDTFMSSSAPEPGTDSTEESIPVKTIIVVKEEDLEGTSVLCSTIAGSSSSQKITEVKAQFEDLGSIHIYSLEPGTINDLQILTDCNREISSKYASEDPLQSSRQYGIIQNANVKRRSTRRQPPPAAPVAPVSAPAHTVEAIQQRTRKKPASPPMKDNGPKLKDESKERSPETNAPARTEAGVSSKPETNKNIAAPKKATSDLFKSFAKANSKKQAKPSPAPQAPAIEDEPMADAEEDEQEEDFQIKMSTKEEREAKARVKQEREEQLRKMMDEEDEDMADAPSAEASVPDDDLQQSNAIDRPASRNNAAEKEPTVTVTGGRRRGRRRVMKKKTMKDEDGYLGASYSYLHLQDFTLTIG